MNELTGKTEKRGEPSMRIPFRKTRNRDGHYELCRPASSEEIIAMAMNLLKYRFRRGSPINSPQTMHSFLKLNLGQIDYESFCVIFLDNRHRLLAFEHIFRGTIDGASVFPREVVKMALGHSAAAVIFVHNHPSGVAEPSHADRAITTRLRDALALVDVRVLDHFVVAGTDIISFAERGLL